MPLLANKFTLIGGLMSIYKEKKERLNLKLSDSDNDVNITVDCFNGTVASVTFKNPKILEVHCGETKRIGKSSGLRGKTIKFSGAANNPDGNKIKITHKIFEVGKDQITYTFPDDYSGVPPYDNNDDNPSYTFYVNFL